MFGIFVAGAFLLTMAVAIGLVVLFFFQREKGGFSFQTLFATYFYLVAVISLIAVFLGASYITKAVASDVFGRDFSYFSYIPETLSDPIAADGSQDLNWKKQQAESMTRQNEQIESQYAQDLFNGISMLVVGLLFLSVHVVGWRKLEPATVRQQSILYRAYIMVQLAIFGIVTLITLPMALGNSLRYWLQAPIADTNLTPGEPLSIALWSTPIWLFFIWLTIRTLQRQESK